jgi:uncharacterized protein (DUF58 family)
MLSLKPTFRGIVLIVMSMIAFCVTMANPSFPTAMVTSICIAILISSFFLSCFSLCGISITRDICIDGAIEDEVYLPLTIKNNTAFRRQVYIIRESFGFSRTIYNEFLVNSLSPYEERIAKRYVLASQRGKFKLNKLKLIGGDPTGFFQHIKTFELSGELIIYPCIERLPTLEMQKKHKILSTVSGQPLSISGQGQDIFGLRDYRHGDPVRLVDWKVSARQKKLLIKEFEAHGINPISIILDVDSKYAGNDRYASNFEYLVKTTASIIHYLSGMYCQTSLITASEKEKGIIFENGSAGNLANITDSILAEIQPFDMNLEKLFEESLNLIPDDSILYCLTMSANENIYQYFDVLSAKGVEIRWFFAPPECFPEIIPGIEQEEPDTSLFGYGMHSPEPSILKRGFELKDAIG